MPDPRPNQQCELKHGRVAMAAMFGILTQTFYQLPDEVRTGIE